MRGRALRYLLNILLVTGALSPAAAAPRLVVFVVVDQLRGDTFSRQDLEFTKGFKTLLDDGQHYTNAHHDHIPTVTAVGHATLLTGQPPGKTGIIGNTWANPQKLLAPTFGETLKERNEKSKVVSLALKARAANMMAGKKADLVLWYDKESSAFTSSAVYPTVPRWVDTVNENGIIFGLPEEDASKEEQEKFLESTTADEILFKIATKAIKEHELGADAIPDLLLISLSATDYLGHRIGPFHPEMKVHLESLDNTLQEFLTELTSQIKKEELLVVLTSDHGVLPLLNAKRIPSKDFRADLKQILKKTAKELTPFSFNVLRLAFRRKILQSYTSPNLYINRKSLKNRKINWDLFLKAAKENLKTHPAIAEVYIPGQWPEEDLYSDIYKKSVVPGRSGDLILRLEPNVLIRPLEWGTTHGSPYAYDTHVPVVFWGGDFKKGKKETFFSVTEIVPYVAAKTLQP